jgi:hypothetical protein
MTEQNLTPNPDNEDAAGQQLRRSDDDTEGHGYRGTKDDNTKDDAVDDDTEGHGYRGI